MQKISELLKELAAERNAVAAKRNNSLMRECEQAQALLHNLEDYGSTQPLPGERRSEGAKITMLRGAKTLSVLVKEMPDGSFVYDMAPSDFDLTERAMLLKIIEFYGLAPSH